MISHADALRDQFGWESLKRIGKDFREAHVAGRFAKVRGATLVRLLKPRPSQRTPDFAALLDEQELWFETTEIDRPGRKRGDEAPLWGTQQIPAEHWITPETYLAEVQQRVGAKVSKAYDKCEGLIIWSNAFPIERDEEIDREWWRKAAIAAQREFTESWVHHQSKWTQIFP